MKNIFLSLFLLSMLGACSKDESATPATPSTTQSSVPSSFTQKVLLETFTGAGQAQCPDGFVMMSSILSGSVNAIPVYIHFSDAMEIAQYTVLQNTYNNGMNPIIPSAMINRIPSLGNYMLNRSQWMNNFSAASQQTAPCGLAITTTVNGATASVNVKAGFANSLNGTYKLTVYLAEDSVTGSGSLYDQRNSYNNVSGHPYFGKGDPILSFRHNYVLRNVLSDATGDALTSPCAAGSSEEKNYSFNASAYTIANLYAIAFIHSAATGQVLNVQRVKIGSSVSWN